MDKRKIACLALALLLALVTVPVTARAADAPSDWAEAPVSRAIAARLVPQNLQSGYQKPSTRAEFSALAVTLYETVMVTEIADRKKFDDTNDVYVEKAAAIGVVAGVGNNRFDPGANLTREQAALMLARLADALGKPLPKSAARFADNAKISGWAAEAVGQMQASGIMQGVGGDKFAPMDPYTREQCIMTIMRMYDRVYDGSAQNSASGLGSGQAGNQFGGAKAFVRLNPPSGALSTLKKPLEPDFIKFGVPFWFNEYMIASAKNKLGVIGAPGFKPDDYFAWADYEDGSGSLCLMILIDAGDESGHGNDLLELPGYGAPFVGKYTSEINVIWEGAGGAGDIHLMFQNGSAAMWVHSNPDKGTAKSGGYMVEMPVCAVDDDLGGDRFYVPLYAILNEVGGGAMFNPFGDGAAFIYSGAGIDGYSGIYESSDETEYKVDVKIDGKTVKVPWDKVMLDLGPNGTFRELVKFYQDSDEWVLWEYKGKYAFFGRALAMKYMSDSEYRGGYNDMQPVKIDAPHDDMGMTGGTGVVIRYVNSFTEKGITFRSDRDLFASRIPVAVQSQVWTAAANADPALPPPSSGGGYGSGGGKGTSMIYISGVLQKGSYYHDGRGETISYYYMEVDADQYSSLAFLADMPPSAVPQEIMVYSTDKKLNLNDYVGKNVIFKYKDPFEANTIYHRRDLVTEVTEAIFSY